MDLAMSSPTTSGDARHKYRARTPSQSHGILYDSSDHLSILTQLNGSIWKSIIGFCVLNVGLAITVHLLRDHYFDRIEVSDQGHGFMGAVVAFLLVSRVNTAMARYNESCTNLGIMFNESRELITVMSILSADGNADEESKKWRLEVAYRTLLLLRTCMAVVDYPTAGIPPWELPELNGEELEDVRSNTYLNPQTRNLVHHERTEFEESLRVPTRIAFLLRQSIHSHSKRLQVPLELIFEHRCLTNVDVFLNAYAGMRKFLTTPVPFPLVQMTRTFNFAYVFTVPFVLLSDDSSIYAHCLQVFILTYGFVGLELVAIELDDPFGDDANDFDNLVVAETVMEDVYLTIRNIDGEEASRKLREKMGHVRVANRPEEAAPSEPEAMESDVENPRESEPFDSLRSDRAEESERFHSLRAVGVEESSDMTETC